MHIDPKVEPWLRRLLDGVENSNHDAEVVATAAYLSMRADECVAEAADTNAKLRADFTACLVEISFTRAGYDVREMSPTQKHSEAARASGCMMRARQIWADNPDQHDDLRNLFCEMQPLIEMREIERAP